LAQYGKRVWNLEGSDDQVARKAIAKTEEFFHKLSVKTRISEYTKDYHDTAKIIHDRFVQRGWLGLGENKDITPKEAEYIVNQAI